jgi:hypothetical protein
MRFGFFALASFDASASMRMRAEAVIVAGGLVMVPAWRAAGRR